MAAGGSLSPLTVADTNQSASHPSERLVALPDLATAVRDECGMELIFVTLASLVP